MVKVRRLAIVVVVVILSDWQDPAIFFSSCIKDSIGNRIYYVFASTAK
jgi:hypothetical protein